jgi:hypothetical protein
VGLAEDRPLLSEAGHVLVRVSGEKAQQIRDVLHDAGLLIVGFFNEKRVALNAFGSGSSAMAATGPTAATRRKRSKCVAITCGTIKTSIPMPALKMRAQV